MRARHQRLAPGAGATARRRVWLLAFGAALATLACGPATGLASAGAGAGAADRSAPAAVRPPNDPLFRHQWNLHAIQIPSAWAATRGEGAVVAVLDTGVAYRTRGRYHRAPDLAGTRFVDGWDFVDGDPYPDDVAPRDDRRSHGTLMAGLIAQTTGNALGAAGVAPDAAIMPVRVLKPDLSGSATAIARGLRFAADHGADVVSLSISGPSETRVLTRAIDYAVGRGVTVVAAAGNDGADTVSWPAAHPRVIAVGAVSRDLSRAPYSNSGAALDLVAPAGARDRVDTGYGPGDGVVAQTLKGGQATFCFCFSASTSAAAAEVSGVAALLVASGRARGPAQVRAALVAGARDLGARGRDDEFGAGLVQARGALGEIGALPSAADGPGRTRPPVPAAGGLPWALIGLGGGLAVVALALVVRSRRSAGRRTSA